MAWTFTCGCKRCPQRTSASTCMLAHIRMHSQVCMRRGPIIAPTRRWWQDGDNRQFARLLYFLMNTGEFTEQREVVKDSLGINKLPILCIFHDESQVLVNMITSTVARRGMRLLESFSKLVEGREVVKLNLAHKLVRFLFAVESRILACARASTCTRNGYSGTSLNGHSVKRSACL